MPHPHSIATASGAPPSFRAFMPIKAACGRARGGLSREAASLCCCAVCMQAQSCSRQAMEALMLPAGERGQVSREAACLC